MLVDIHTNLFWYPDHLSEEFVETSWAAKRAKMRLTGDVHCAVDDNSWKHNFDCRPEQLLEVAKFARAHPDRFQGWCSVDPNDPACIEQLEHCVTNLGLRGLKLGPIYQN